MEISELRRKTDVFLNERSRAKQRLEVATVALTAARMAQIDLDAVQNTLQYVATRVQTNFGDHVGGLVTKALHHVFGAANADSFIVRFHENRGKTEAQLRMCTADGAMAHPYDSDGGGTWNVIAFAMQCACLVLEQPQKTRFIALDEPFHFLHGAETRRRALSMLINTCETLKLQAIVVHQTDDKEDPDAGLAAIVGHKDCLVYTVKQPTYENSVVEEGLT